MNEKRRALGSVAVVVDGKFEIYSTNQIEISNFFLLLLWYLCSGGGGGGFGGRNGGGGYGGGRRYN